MTLKNRSNRQLVHKLYSKLRLFCTELVLNVQNLLSLKPNSKPFRRKKNYFSTEKKLI